ncbi:TWiK family of potassium channels protein 7 [Orchesella cincta]|uniref:TWiK family of potassium channels protein 7 n=1 Tax=Orchesella cincta TaxID=48709 RepID=A0A1D2MWV5_ORCCI|nr:TWiK family of potassium channels protein 7 [Orchesella cincta]
MSRSGSGSGAGGGGSSAGRMSDLARRRGLSIDVPHHIHDDDDVNDEEDEEANQKGKCARCMSACKQVTTFLLSHVGLISLVVGYCIMGAFTFEALESSHEIQVKRNMTKVREAVTHHLWVMTKNADVIIPNIWLKNTTERLQDFETALIRAMKKGGWDGSENEDTQQWTFSGALFYSIVVITTIGK